MCKETKIVIARDIPFLVSFEEIGSQAHFEIKCGDADIKHAFAQETVHQNFPMEMINDFEDWGDIISTQIEMLSPPLPM